MTERQYDILFFCVVIFCAALIIVPAILANAPARLPWQSAPECWHGRTVDTLLRPCE